MIDPVRAFLEGTAITVPVMPADSRYYGVGTGVFVTPDGRTLTFLRRRFLPQPDRFTVLQEHALTEGDRVDNLAHRFLGDPGQFWRLCDANGVMRPAELTYTPSSEASSAPVLPRMVRITLPEGVPGPSDE
jgi:hypothetical protein